MNRQFFAFKASLALAAVVMTAALPARTAHACACCDTFKVVNVASWDTLNVRAGPGMRYEVVDRLAPGEGCIAWTGRRRGAWVLIRVGDTTGWVSSRYLGIVR